MIYRRIVKKLLCVLLAASITAGSLSPGVLTEKLFSLGIRAMAADTVSDPPALKIPQGGSVDGYDPEKNGYYAYLHVFYEEPGTEGYSIKDGYMPILCFDGCIYVSPDVLASITELTCEVKDDAITVYNWKNTRRIHMTVGKSDYIYEEGYAGKPNSPLVKRITSRLKAPVRMDDRVFIPLDPILCIFGMSPMISDDCYYFTQPQEDAMDVLMRLYDHADHDQGVAYYHSLPIAEIGSGATFWAANVDYLFGLISFDPASWKMCIPSFTENRMDTRYYEEIAKDLLSSDSELTKALDESSLEMVEKGFGAAGFIAEGTYEAMLKAKTGMDQSLIKKALEDLRYLDKAFDKNTGVRLIPDSLAEKLISRYSLWDKAGDVISVSGLAIDCLFAIANNARIYTNRDTISGIGMAVLLKGESADKKNTGSILSLEEYKSFQKELRNFMPDQWVEDMIDGENSGDGKKESGKKATDKNETASAVFRESADEVALKAAKFIAESMVSLPAKITSAALSTVETVARAFNKSPIGFANARIKAYYCQPLIIKVGQKLYGMEKSVLDGDISDEELQELISLAYIYLRLCKLECDYLSNTIGVEESFASKCRKCSKELTKMIAILTRDCPRDIEEEQYLLPDTAKERIDSAADLLGMGILEKSVIPLYVKVRGEVREKTEGEPPVKDAICNFSLEEDNDGLFTGEENGAFSAVIPMAEPYEVLEDTSAIDEIPLLLHFSSSSIEGTADEQIDVEPGWGANLGVVYLNSFNWYEYIRDNILPEMGYASLKTNTKKIGENWIGPSIGEGQWDLRKGILSAQIADLNGDSIDDCILYYFSNNYTISADFKGTQNNLVTTLYARLLTRNKTGDVIEKESRQIFYDYGGEFCDAVGGIIEVDGKQYVYFECNSYAYYANGYGALYTFYTFDGDHFRPEFAVGKTDGGSIEFEYSIISYDESGDYTGGKVTQSGEPWYNADGKYSKRIICVDDDWKQARKGSGAVSTMMDYFDPEDAMELGLEVITGIEPEMVTLKNADNGYAFGDRYPSYRTDECFTQAFHYNCNGEKTGSSGARNMTVSVEDNTRLKEHIEAAISHK